jgi:hypothetical protein
MLLVSLEYNGTLLIENFKLMMEKSWNLVFEHSAAMAHGHGSVTIPNFQYSSGRKFLNDHSIWHKLFLNRLASNLGQTCTLVLSYCLAKG